uniref:Preprodefensin n=1 Tax=Rhipicephalus zambeziensis TaxID=60191 RepID=A0A224YDI1_9ACAR
MLDMLYLGGSMRTTSVIVLLAVFIVAAAIRPPVLPGHHATKHHGPHYEGGAYGCPFFGVICKLRCHRAGHGKGYCDGPRRGRCMCPHW